jgi:D-serine dehydratase
MRKVVDIFVNYRANWQELFEDINSDLKQMAQVQDWNAQEWVYEIEKQIATTGDLSLEVSGGDTKTNNPKTYNLTHYEFEALENGMLTLVSLENAN